MLFHITTRAAWERARGVGVYHADSLDRSAPISLALATLASGEPGSRCFIHLSTEAQWPRTLARFYADQPDLVLLVIDPARAGDIRYERADGDDFPHLYNALAVGAVVDVRDII